MNCTRKLVNVWLMLSLCMENRFNSEKNRFIEEIFDKELRRKFIRFNVILVFGT